MRNNKTTIKFTFLQSSIIGLLISLTVMMSMICIGAIFIQNEYISIDSVGIIAMVINFLAPSCGMIIAGKLQKGREAVTAGVAAIMYSILLICNGMLFFKGLSASIFGGLITVAAAYISAYFLLNSTKNRHRHKRKNRPSC